MSFENIKLIIARKLGVDLGEIKLSSKFKEELGIDSLDIFEIVMEVEEQYSIEIPTEDLEDMRVVADLVNYLEGLSA
ncbi:MAG: acyl carrier protein [Gracilibacter sp. BRH_c7a]|nr:MAG: acyl carrier protein [Gracilibacter sp. BRH_c7a]